MLHSHQNVHIHKHQVKGKNLVFSIFLNVLITVAQGIGGLLSGSLALISDALHNFSDVLSLVFSYVAHKLSRRKASIDYTFGYKRAELIAAFINAITLLIVALLLGFEAIQRFFHPESIKTGLVIWLALLGIVANGLSVLLLQKDAEHNLNIKSAYLHLLTDMMASIAVLVGGLLMKFYGWFWIDSVLTIFISIYLIIVSIDLFKSSIKMLMLFTPEEIDIKAIVREVHKIPGVGKLHHIHVWYLNEEELHLEAHLDCAEDIKMSEFNELLHQIEIVLFQNFGINHINIQPEYKKEDPKEFIVQD
ncbi:cation transporter [Flavobacterium columnare]|uniref:Cation efflux system protein CzcD n=2 Tax=Flavobacterium columnare TaxID=996 RepID=G8X9J7_FLACA|nr:cation diffusion facilitator family transporter [Flavobacterium columnare]AEW86560.1 cation efflux system protein CzcD [Flavobacterium columnare ATCC 49512]AMO20467.1 cation transporter [Flavobacterium columnare]ANO49741.1 cation efflux system protein CzcD [Flavobacterium columnare]APT22334.1 cation transporter [Flavobacterium columnare]AUX18432.1 cobalt transporter [Flavobacterium columnare]